MIKIFNTPALTRRQRFGRALIVGLICAAACVVVLYVLGNVFHLHFPILFLAVGFAIGYAIQYFGKGVQMQFSILAVVLTLAVIVICDLLWYEQFGDILAMLTQFGVSSLIELAYRIGALYLAFRYARVV